MEERVSRGWDDFGFIAAATADDRQAAERALAASDEFDQLHPPRPPEAEDYVFAARSDLYLLELAFSD